MSDESPAKPAANPAFEQAAGEQLAKTLDAWDAEDRRAALRRRRARGNGAAEAGPRLDVAGKTEQAVMRDFVARHQDRLRFDHDRGRWLVWDRHHWRVDRRRNAFFWVLNHCQGFGKKAEAARFAAAVETMARAMPEIATCADDWNPRPDLVACPAGVIELATGSLRPGQPADMIDRALAHSPDPTPPPLWFSFLERIFAADPAITDFLQRWCGYCLSGDTSEHKFVFAIGSGGNGKGTLIGTLEAIWGELARTASMDAFLESRHDRHSTELARLHGAHLVTAQENREGRHWDEAKIKALTGGDRIAARFMRQDEFEFIPRFKLMFSGNHRPQLRSVDEAIRRRVLMLPFNVTIPAAERDPDLGRKLAAEAPQILAWAVEGYRHWRKLGLKPPAAVTDATDEYLAGQDDLAQWLAEQTEPLGYGTCPGKDLYRNWHAWQIERGGNPGSIRTFFDNLEIKGFANRRTMHGVGVENLQLKRPPLSPYHDC